MNTKRKITINFLVGISSEILTIILGIVIPRLILTSYGSEINGLISSVTQIYSYIALIEAGIGMATVQALYRTVGNEDNNATNRVLAATNKYYYRSGIVYLFAIIIFAIIYPLVVSTDIPIRKVVLIIVFNGVGSVVNFFFQGKYYLLLQAEGKDYVKTALNMCTNVIKNIGKIVLMTLGFDVIIVQAIAIVISFIQMIYITLYIKKKYQWIDLSVEPDYKSIAQSKNVLIHQLSGLVYNNTDAITLSVFCGLKIVSIYTMYSMLFGMISTALSTVISSITFSLGQKYHNDRNAFYKYIDVFEYFYITLVFTLYSIANFFIRPFIILYTNGVDDVSYVDQYLPLLFIITYVLSCGRIASNIAINIAGHFKKTQYRSILESVINLTVSIIAVQFIGIYGVLIGTIVALLYRSNDMIIYASKHILNRSAWITYKRWIVNLTVFVGILFINHFMTFNLDSYLKIFLICIPYTIITLMIFFTCASIADRKTAKYAFSLIKGFLHR